ncbi:MATE family efflux transporter [Secundilactobacillus kimchicus]|uniref:MATE family efflux transporter n=1 Tax=Secundilactobacillus kimchicus TaxID=528209 RepID=UPI0024A83F7A|nr:MATE family efflux transporter [Secundilactobacillus kimchicus]
MIEKNDLTSGSPLKKIITFSLPLVSGNVFQQFYTLIDSFIISHFLGINALAAVGAFYPLSFLILGFIQGCCIGFSIPLAQSIGRKDNVATKQDLLSGTIICCVLICIMTPSMIFSAQPLLTLLHTPERILTITTIFTIISFAGIPANILYNYSASLLRSFGDSTHPFHFLVFSLFLNIGLALTFILLFHLGLNGVALATVISETVAGLLNLYYYIHHTTFPKIKISRQYLNYQSLIHVSTIGFPMGAEYSVSAIGAILMQNAINILGTDAIAAQSAGDKIRQFFTLPMESLGMGIATYMAQNFGAHDKKRISQGLLDGSLIQLSWSIVSLLLVWLLKKTLITLVLGVSHGHVYNLAENYLVTISFFFIIHGLLMIFRNTLQGLGHSMVAILSGFGELIGRLFASILATLSFGYVAICYANQLAWGISLVYCCYMVWKILSTDHQLNK